MTVPDPRIAFHTWRAKAEHDLGGRSFDKLQWRTADGFVVGPLQTAADLVDLPHLAAVDLLRTRRGWRIRELITAADPETANARAHAALAGGADEIEFCFDALARDARDPSPEPDDEDGAPEDDAFLSWSAPGDGGIAIATRDDFDTALDGIELAAVPVFCSADEGAVAALAWLIRRADQLGVPRHALRGGFDIDPLSRLTTRQVELHADGFAISRRAAPDQVFREAAAIVTGCARDCPGLRPLVLDGQVHHLTGATPGTELGATLAGIVEVARRLGRHGVSFDQLARASTVRLQVGHDLLPQIAKLRALRLLWAKIAREFGAGDDALIPQVLGVTSGRARAEDYDQRANLLRTATAAFAAVTGGCDALVTMPFDDDADDDAAWRLARDQQHLLRHEAHLDRVADPFGGSFAIETLTDRIGRRAWSVLQEIEREGGWIAAARNGRLSAREHGEEGRREQEFRTRRRVLVGISRFADLTLGGTEPGPDRGDNDDATHRRIEAHARWRTTRDSDAAAAHCAGIAAAAAADIFDAVCADGADTATLAELATAGWPPEGVVLEHRFLPALATDGHEFEELRLWADATLDERGSLPEVMLLPLGDARSARARADFARDVFTVGGFAVHDPGLLESIEAAQRLIDERAAAVVILCSDDGSYRELVAALAQPIRDRDGRVWIAGRPDEDLAGELDGAVHLGADIVELLRAVQIELGVQESDA